MSSDLDNLNRTLNNLGCALEILEKNKKILPDEYKFLLDPDFKKQLERAKGKAERILMSAQKVGELEGPENVDKERIKEVVRYLQERGLLEDTKIPKEENDSREKGGNDKDIEGSTKNSKEDGSEIRDESKDPEEKVTKVKNRAMRIIEQLLDSD